MPVSEINGVAALPGPRIATRCVHESGWWEPPCRRKTECSDTTRPRDALQAFFSDSGKDFSRTHAYARYALRGTDREVRLRMRGTRGSL